MFLDEERSATKQSSQVMTEIDCLSFETFPQGGVATVFCSPDVCKNRQRGEQRSGQHGNCLHQEREFHRTSSFDALN
jgi:hypothetical protein